MFKIAYCAGHHLGNSKGVPNYMGLGSIREWTINDQVARHFAEAASQYEGVETLRTDDPTGKTLIDIPERCAAANEWGADVYIDMHHNAGIYGGTGGGAVAFYRPKDARSEAYANAIYDAVIAAGGLRGNRYDTVIATNWLTMKYSKMSAVLMEYGFMDSKTDAPIIITDAYSKLVAYATMEGIAEVAKLKKKAPAKEPEKQIYRIRKSWEDAASQTGAYIDLERAKPACPKGYTVYDKDGNAVYSVSAQTIAQREFVEGIRKAIGVSAGDDILSKTVTLSRYRNNRHKAVKVVQKYLSALGYKQVGIVDGVAGAKFEAAVKSYQKDNGCVVDGEITAKAKTWRKLLGVE